MPDNSTIHPSATDPSTAAGSQAGAFAPGATATGDITRQSALRTLTLERGGIAALEAEFHADGADGLAAKFDQAVALVLSRTGRVIVSGMGKSGHVARKIAATLASTGTPAYFVHPGEASHGDLGMIKPSDVLLLLSWSGETSELADIITYSRRHRIGLISMTSGRNSTLASRSDIALVLPKSEEACPNGLAPTTSTIMQLAIGDALAVALLEARGFSASDFKNFHPGGKLGASLTYVRDIMHTAQAMPLIATGRPMAEAIVEMSGKSFGCVGVVSTARKLAGIITDGDLRRHMSPDLMTRPVDDVMTRTPITIDGGILAAEALELLNSKKRTTVFVVDAGNVPQGILHLHDLLRLGVA